MQRRPERLDNAKFDNYYDKEHIDTIEENVTNILKDLPETFVEKEKGKSLVPDKEIEKLKKSVAKDDEKVSEDNTWSSKKINDTINKISTDIGLPSVFKATKTDPEESDTNVITKYFETNPEPTPVVGDVFVIRTEVDNIHIEDSSYIYEESGWVAISGKLDADKVILREDFIAAGKYRELGTIKKELDETIVVPAKGKSVSDFLSGILAEEIQPRIEANPKVVNFTLREAKEVEAGTKITEFNFENATFKDAQYTFNPKDAGCKVTSYKIDRVAIPAKLSKESVATTQTGVDNNDSNGFTIGDGESDFNSVSYKATIEYSEGLVAKTNLGNNSKPEIKAQAGSVFATTKAITSFRKYFYGISTDVSDIDSNWIRTNLTHSTSKYAPKTLTLNVTTGTKRVVIACESINTGVTKIINETLMNLDVTGTFEKHTVEVEGAEGYASKSYNYWIYEPLKPYSSDAILHITLG